MDDFLHYYFIEMEVWITTGVFKELAMAYFRHAAVFFDPEAHTSRSVAYEIVATGSKQHVRERKRSLTFDGAQAAAHFADGTLAGLGMILTLCPISNVCLNGALRMKDIPIREFLDAGIRFSINTDDPAYFGGYILDNHCAVQEAFQLSLEEWKLIASNSIEGSWCDERRQEELRRTLDQCNDKFS